VETLYSLERASNNNKSLEKILDGNIRGKSVIPPDVLEPGFSPIS
jgi:hypothetical protein